MLYFLLLFAFYGSATSLFSQTSGNPGVNVCEASATPATVRAEGIAELAGDILVTCVNGNAPGVPVTASQVVMNVFVHTSVDVTNNVNFGSGANVTDAVLVVNENNCASPSATGGRFGGCGAPSAAFQDPQLGQQTASDRLQWLSVRAPVPSGPGNPSVTTIRITALRLRASQRGVPQAAVIPDTQITATVSLAAQGFSMPNGGLVNIGFPILGLMVSLPGGLAGEQCRVGELSVPLILREGFGAALRPPGPPSFFPDQTQTESGYFGAAHPGRILLRFSNIPQGVRLSLPRIIETGNAAISGDALRVQWVQSAAADGTGGTVSAQAGTVVIDSPPGGSAFVVYEVIDGNPSVLESLPVTTTASWTTSALPDTVRMSAYPAPLSPVTAANFAAPEPRFLDAASMRPFFRLAPCRSTLLFPYAADGGGAGTRLVLDNTTSDAPGTNPQTGACRLRFRGQNAPSEQSTASVGPGQQLDIALSSVAPGFVGHVVAECDFEAATGKAILTNSAGAVAESKAERLGSNGAGVATTTLPLLFPYAVNATGFDTRIAIANPTLDVPGGVPAQAGSCRIDYFGQNAPASQLSTPLAPGSELVFTLSAGAPAMGITGAPGFSGYVIAACEFAHARGLAAITRLAGPSQPLAGFGLAAEPFNVSFVIDPSADDATPVETSTHLLIPYASSRAGDETTLAISNTSRDFLGTTPQAGSCSLQYHGDGAGGSPGPQTFSLSAGEQAVFRLSQGDPARALAPAADFRGYLTLACDFPRGRAAALVTGASSGSFAQSAERFALPRDATPTPLLQPYLSRQAGEDRIVALSSTSLDPFGTTPVNAACSLLFRGAGAPGPTGVPLAAGSVRAFVLSRGLPALGVPAAPEFKGFLLTACDAGLVRAVDYRIATPSLSPFCELDATPGVQSSDVTALSAMLGQTVGVGHPGDPDGDGMVTAVDIQYCSGIAQSLQPGPDPAPEPPMPTPEPSAAAADLRIAWQASPATARPQRSLVLRAVVSNAGPGAAASATATLYPPFTYVISNSPGACSGSGGVWTCNLGALAAGQSVTLEFSGAVASAAADELVAFAQISSSAYDPDPGNNIARIAVPLESQVDLAASAYLVPRFPAPGETATLTVSVTNRGPAVAQNVQLAADLAPEVQLLQIPSGCSLAGRSLDCPLGALDPGRTRAFLLQVRIALGGGLQGGTTSPFLAVVSGSTTTSDYEPDNNTFVAPFAP